MRRSVLHPCLKTSAERPLLPGAWCDLNLHVADATSLWDGGISRSDFGSYWGILIDWGIDVSWKILASSKRQLKCSAQRFMMATFSVRRVKLFAVLRGVCVWWLGPYTDFHSFIEGCCVIHICIKLCILHKSSPPVCFGWQATLFVGVYMLPCKLILQPSW